MRLPTSPLVLPPLPYKLDALEPILSEEAMHVHYYGHHKTYVDTYNKLLIEGGKVDDMEFNYGGHVLHSLFWKNLAPFPSRPSYEAKRLIEEFFPSFKHFVEKLIHKAINIKGSGWTVLTGDFKIITIPNHELQEIKGSKRPLLVIDGWEHLWYLQYQNKKIDCLNNIIHVVDWDQLINRHLKNTVG